MPIATDELVRAAVAVELLDAELASALRVEARRQRADLLEVVTTRGRLPAAALYRAVAEERGLLFVDAGTALPEEEMVARMPDALMRRRLVLPVHGADEDEVILLSSDPDERAALETLERLAGGRPVGLALADPDALRIAIDRTLGREKRADDPAGEASADPVGLLDQILREGYLQRASDLHIEPMPEGTRVRIRVDGRLREQLTGLRAADGVGLVSRVKVLASLDIAEHRAPQDGGFRWTVPGGGGEDAEVDIRVATAPTRWGERATLRLLGTHARGLGLEALGMSARDLDRFAQVIRRPWGMLLLTGPTGGGKTTTLYGALRELNDPGVNIMTVEDPIEYVVPGINQLQVSSEKVTFASALRSLLRHDPDVLMVGEIRDRETADVALKAALTGHFVFSTLHTNTAVGAVTRLVDLGCEPYLVGSTLAGAIAQRLVRRLCVRCRHARTATEVEALALGLIDGGAPVEVFDAVGCAGCLGTGFDGRTGLFSALWVEPDVARAISTGAGEESSADHGGDRHVSRRQDGREKVLAGVTTLDEVVSVTVE